MNNSKNYWKKKNLKKFHAASNVSLFRFLGEYGFKFKNKKVLELGFFHGADLLEFKKRESEVFGIDINQSAVKNLQKIISKKRVKKIDLGINQIPFKEKFDLIYSRDFIYYLNKKEIIFHLNNVLNSLKKGGLYLFQFIEKDLIYSKNKKIDHDHLADTKMDKYGNEFKLKTLELEKLPKYIQNNKEKYNEWFDFD